MKIFTLDYPFIGASLFGYLIQIDENNAVLVDGGCNVDEEKIRDMLSKTGVDPSSIRLIIITHAHYDHVQNTAEWVKITGAKVLCHKNAQKYLETCERSPYQFVCDHVAMADFIKLMNDVTDDRHVPVTPDYVIGDEDYSLEPFDIPGKIIYTPGHSDSCISLVLENGTVFAGDSITTMAVDENGNEIPCLSIISDDWNTSVESLEKLVCSGETFYGGHNRAFSKEQLQKLLKDLRQY